MLPQAISHIFFQGCSPEIRTELLSRIPVHEGELLSQDLLDRTVRAVQEFASRLEISVAPAFSRDEFLKLPEEIRKRVRPPAADRGVNLAICDPEGLPKRIKVKPEDQNSMLIESPKPQTVDSGEVRLTVLVGKDGSVLEATPLSGSDSLASAAMSAVKHWKYRPTLLNGRPVEVLTEVELEF